jgi:hypothetical protein
MKRPERPRPNDEELTPEEFATWDDQVQAWQAAQHAKIYECLEAVSKAKSLLEEVFDEGTFGLTPDLYAEALRLRQEMNERLEFHEGRKLFLPPGTGFVGPRLCGFEVVIVDRPIAMGPSDFQKLHSFVATRK